MFHDWDKNHIFPPVSEVQLTGDFPFQHPEIHFPGEAEQCDPHIYNAVGLGMQLSLHCPTISSFDVSSSLLPPYAVQVENGFLCLSHLMVCQYLLEAAWKSVSMVSLNCPTFEFLRQPTLETCSAWHFGTSHLPLTSHRLTKPNSTPFSVSRTYGR